MADFFFPPPQRSEISLKNFRLWANQVIAIIIFCLVVVVVVFLLFFSCLFCHPAITRVLSPAAIPLGHINSRPVTAALTFPGARLCLGWRPGDGEVRSWAWEQRAGQDRSKKKVGQAIRVEIGTRNRCKQVKEARKKSYRSAQSKMALYVYKQDQN